jgi:hypothetical protein
MRGTYSSQDGTVLTMLLEDGRELHRSVALVHGISLQLALDTPTRINHLHHGL